MITVNFDKAKTIAHEQRRIARDAEFAPLDIKATIPNQATAAESARKAIRDRYAVIQSNINSATEITKLKNIVNSFCNNII